MTSRATVVPRAQAEGFRFFQLLRRQSTPDDDVNYISMSAWSDRDAFDKWWNSKSFANMAQAGWASQGCST